MTPKTREFVAEQCFRVEQKLTGLLEEKVDELARMIAKTVKTLPTKEDVISLQEQIDELRVS